MSAEKQNPLHFNLELDFMFKNTILLHDLDAA